MGVDRIAGSVRHATPPREPRTNRLRRHVCCDPRSRLSRDVNPRLKTIRFSGGAAAATGLAQEAITRGKVVRRALRHCHGEGDGQGPLAPDLSLPPRNFKGQPLRWGNSTCSITDTVTHGRLNVMPSFDGALTPALIKDVAAFVWSLIPDANKRADLKPVPHPAHDEPGSSWFGNARRRFSRTSSERAVPKAGGRSGC